MSRTGGRGGKLTPLGRGSQSYCPFLIAEGHVVDANLVLVVEQVIVSQPGNVQGKIEHTGLQVPVEFIGTVQCCSYKRRTHKAMATA